MDTLNIDDFVDYRTEYSAVIKKSKIVGNRLNGLCPFHDDQKESFSINLKTGQWICFAEGISGNYISFLAKLHGTDTKLAYKEILKKYGKDDSNRTGAPKQSEPKGQANPDPSSYSLESYSLEQYSEDKHLPIEFLKDACHLSTYKNKAGVTSLRIPYYDAVDQEFTFRIRFANKEFRWKKGSSGNIGLYGEWLLPNYAKGGYAMVVEGESDTQSLWYLGFQAIGVPGSDMFKPVHAERLQGLILYLHQEPDRGGQVFVSKVCAGLRESGFNGKVYTWSCSKSIGVKDSSDVLIKYGPEEAATQIKLAMHDAEEIDYSHEEIPETIPKAPINLRCPIGWVMSADGIGFVDDQTEATLICCRTPILLTKRLQSIESGAEKVEIAFLRDGQWIRAIYPRSTIFSSKTILALADIGCMVTSENCRKMVSFLGALEAENYDVIPKCSSTSSFGWQTGNRFLPGHDGGLVLDVDPTLARVVAAYSEYGTMEGWVSSMAPYREQTRFRFMMAASFAAPLLSRLNQRVFFVDNWGNSRAGKTAALKAALSVWGDPERLMGSFNATQAGLEKTAALCCDLPLGIDERQLAGSDQELVEKIVYMIASGSGKIRANKDGGLNPVDQWRTIALTTGEEPLTATTSKMGVSTRVLELYGAPFQFEKDAGAMHHQATQNYGWAGPKFIKNILRLGDIPLRSAFDQMRRCVHAASNGKNGSHIASVSVVALADAMIDSWFFSSSDEADGESGEASPPLPEEEVRIIRYAAIRERSWRKAKAMAIQVLLEQEENNCGDINEEAVQFLADWVVSNKAYFGSDVPGQSYGTLSNDGSVAYIFSTTLTSALERAGFSSRKTLRYLAETGLVKAHHESNGKMVYSAAHRFGGKIHRMVEFRIGEFINSDIGNQQMSFVELDEVEPNEDDPF